MPLDIGIISGGVPAYAALRPFGGGLQVAPDSSRASPLPETSDGSGVPFRFIGPLTGATAVSVQEQGETARGGSSPTAGGDARPQGAVGDAGEGEGADESGSAAREGGDSAGPTELTEEEQETVDELRARDAEVRRHEQAHAAVGGQYAGSPSYEYTQGPDGNRYATNGEVSIDASPVPDDPQATILKMQVVKAAALAPAEPSAQDRRIAALADQRRAQAQAELSRQSLEELTGQGEDGESDGVSAAGAESVNEAGGAGGGGGNGPAFGLTTLFSTGSGDTGRVRGGLFDARF